MLLLLQMPRFMHVRIKYEANWYNTDINLHNGSLGKSIFLRVSKASWNVCSVNQLLHRSTTQQRIPSNGGPGLSG